MQARGGEERDERERSWRDRVATMAGPLSKESSVERGYALQRKALEDKNLDHNHNS